MSITPISIKLQTNLQNQATQLDQAFKGNDKGSFADHLLDAAENVANDGHSIENLSSTSTDATELAMAMDQFLVELNALKALVDETRKAIDRIFQESRA
jgi:hypothetical protein